MGSPVPQRGRRDRPGGRLDRIGELELNFNIEAAATAEADGCATDEELAALRADPDRWVTTVLGLLRETDGALESARRITGRERDMVLDDLAAERTRLGAALTRLTGIQPARPVGSRRHEEKQEPPGDLGPTGPPALNASWDQGQVVLWAASREGSADEKELAVLLEAASAGAIDWDNHSPIQLPDRTSAFAVAAPVSEALGWLVGVGARQVAPDAGLSLRWLGGVAVWGTRLVAEGSAIPSLSVTAPKGRGQGTAEVRWSPALLDTATVAAIAGRMPGAVRAPRPGLPPERLCREVVAAVVEAVCRAGASRLVAPATSPVARKHSDVREAVMSGLAGGAFRASGEAASSVSDDLRRWASPVASGASVGLTVRLETPGSDGGWLLKVEATTQQGPMDVAAALEVASAARAAEFDAQLSRLERLLPALRRPTRRRGVVVLDGSEAWDLMTHTGPVLVAAGFSVRVPSVARERARPRLHMSAEAFAGRGAQERSKVRWTVLVGDADFTAADIARLAAQARPLVETRNGWVELERADLDAAAALLAEASKTTEMSGAAILRHAVGLEGAGFGGSVMVDGSGWAADLIQNAAGARSLPAPDGFRGELRPYQADARGWLAFLDAAGLGGCLALDMGLGKTPTLLAHIMDPEFAAGGGDGSEGGDPNHEDTATAPPSEGPGPSGSTLVIAPPAVLGNWAAESARFTPNLRVRLHHGADRGERADFAGVDIVLTTYATAVRDVELLAGIDWRRVVLDEAQAIKNPGSEAARQLRRIPARSRVALTGTPVENGLSDLWSILDYTNPGLVGTRNAFVEQLSGAGAAGGAGEAALRALNGLLVFRRTKAEPEVAAELPDRVDEVDHCPLTPEQVGLYQAVLDRLVVDADSADRNAKKGHVLAAITALKQVCDHPAAYIGAENDPGPLEGRSGKLARLEEIVDSVFASGERMLIFTRFARWGERLAQHLTVRTRKEVPCYHGGLTRVARDRMIADFQAGKGAGALVLSIKAGGSGLNLTAANHVVLYDRWWNPAVEDQARDRAWRIGQDKTVVCHRLVCPGTVDERVEEVVAGKRRIADLVLPASSSLSDLSADQLRAVLGLDMAHVEVDDLARVDNDGDGDATGDQESEEAA